MEAVIGKITTMLKSKLHGLKGKATEQGKRKVSLEVAKRICDSLGITIEESIRDINT